MKKKSKGNIVFSTDPNFQYDNLFEKLASSKASNQELRIWLDRKKGNRLISRITGFELNDNDLQSLKKELQSLCGAGGSAKDSDILIQGDHREKIKDFLISKDYKVKLAGG